MPNEFVKRCPHCYGEELSSYEPRGLQSLLASWDWNPYADWWHCAGCGHIGPLDALVEARLLEPVEPPIRRYECAFPLLTDLPGSCPTVKTKPVSNWSRFIGV